MFICDTRLYIKLYVICEGNQTHRCSIRAPEAPRSSLVTYRHRPRGNPGQTYREQTYRENQIVSLEGGLGEQNGAGMVVKHVQNHAASVRAAAQWVAGAQGWHAHAKVES